MITRQVLAVLHALLEHMYRPGNLELAIYSIVRLELSMTTQTLSLLVRHAMAQDFMFHLGRVGPVHHMPAN